VTYFNIFFVNSLLPSWENHSWKFYGYLFVITRDIRHLRNGGAGDPHEGVTYFNFFFDHSSSPGHLTNPRKFGRDWFIIGRDIAHFVIRGHNMGG
jgi:hypothetical protein